MSIVLRSDFENVKAQLEDTQESLAAAFARIEVFRQREKLLLAEVSKLRTAQAAGASGTQQGELTQQQEGSSTSTVSQAAGTAPCTQQQAIPSSSSTQESLPTQAQQQQADPGPDLPCYITEVEGHLPVMLLSNSSSRKTPGSIVITPDYVDFVELRARIKRHAFIGITAASARGQSAGKSGLKLKHLLPSCISPSTAQQPSSPAAPRHPKPPGGPHLVQQPSGSGASLTTGSFPNSTTNSESTTGAWIAASAAADIQPETSSSSLNWQQQLHFQVDVPAAAAPPAAVAASPWRGPRTSAGAAGSPASPPPAAVLGTTPETPGGWASPHSLRHCPTWHAGQAVTEAELTEAGAAAASGGGSGSPRGSNGSSCGWTEGEGGKDAKGVWKILWRGGGYQQQLSFEATQTTREVLHKHTLRWLGEPEIEQDELSQLAAAAAAAGGGDGLSSSTGTIAAGVAAAAAAAAGSADGGAQLSVPRHLTPGSYTPRLSEPSSIIKSGSSSGRVSSSSIGVGGSSGIIPGSPSIGGISMGYGIGVGANAGRTQNPSAAAAAAAGGSSDQQQQQQLVAGLAHIAGALPPRYQSRDWQLLYSTARHGISLQTLFRKAAGQSATVLLVRDAGGYVFGAFCIEAWKPNSRFFGTGETFVFQLAPHKVMWPWRVGSTLKNDFFQYAQPESIGIGGLGAFAIWLDGELLHGSSGSCGTFGSPCLASREEFKVSVLELWGLQ